MQQPREQQHDRVRESEQDRVQVLLSRLTMILLRGRAEGAFIGSLLACNPTHPPLLVLILGAFFVLIASLVPAKKGSFPGE